MCKPIQSALHNRASEIQNKIGQIRDKLSVLEGNLLDIVDNYYETDVNEWKGIRCSKGVE